MPVSDVLDLLAVKTIEADEIKKKSGKNTPQVTKLVKRRRKD